MAPGEGQDRGSTHTGLCDIPVPALGKAGCHLQRADSRDALRVARVRLADGSEVTLKGERGGSDGNWVRFLRWGGQSFKKHGSSGGLEAEALSCHPPMEGDKMR